MFDASVGGRAVACKGMTAFVGRANAALTASDGEVSEIVPPLRGARDAYGRGASRSVKKGNAYFCVCTSLLKYITGRVKLTLRKPNHQLE
jgi:hypothetical protein